jgi:hypothetical protein
MGGLVEFAILITLLIIISSIVGVVLYVLMSLGLYRLSTNAGIDYAWLSWVPIGNLYILGRLLDSVQFSSFEIPNLYIVLPVAFVVNLIFEGVAIIGPVLFILMYILMIICEYNLFCRYRNDKAVLYTVLGAIFFFLVPIFIFIIRNDSPTS